ncbi:MAG TPA: thioredoxin-dependent thiol peroxidase [Acidimicrobiia bacterium]|jgi:peroxiredoxin Q/BCP|nr:thioredoxin-dependent thiol peroxidase [Acidimicrobiia bacterium]
MSVDFTLPDQDGQPYSSADHRGRKLIVFFYPAAMTPGCTAEACDFRDNYAALSQAGYDLVGISPDAPAKNARFKEKEGLNFPLLSDTDHKVAEQFGAWGPKMLYGKESVGLIRSTFVIGADGELEREFRNVKAKGHVARLTEELGVS